MPFPPGLATVQVTGENVLALDGSPLAGIVIFSAGALVADPAQSLLLSGSAIGTVASGVMAPLLIASTDSVSPGFTYTISFRLQTPDGSQYPALPVSGVAIPAALGSVDLSQLPVSSVLPPATGSYVTTVNGSSGPVTVTPDAHFELFFTAQQSLVVPHNLGKKPAVTVMDSSGNECRGTVQHLDLNNTLLTFSAPFSGSVTCN